MSVLRRSRTIAALSAAVLAAGFAAPLAAQTAAGPTPATADHNAGRDPAPQGFSAVFGAGSDAAVATYMRVEDGDTIRVFCIEHGVDFPTWDPSAPPSPLPPTGYTAQPRSAASGSNVAGAAWLVANLTYGPGGAASGSPVGTPLTATGGLTSSMLVDAEASAVQLALWNLVNGVDISATVNSAIRNRALELVTLAQSNSLPESLHSFGISLAPVETGEGQLALVAVAEGVRGAEEVVISGASITVSVPAGSGIDLDPTPGVQESVTLTTDAAGSATTASFPAPSADVSASASAQFTLPRGTVLTAQGADGVPGNSDDAALQQVITADPARVDRTASATVPAAGTGVPTTVPEERPSVDLPRTGGWLSAAVIVLGAAAGAAGLWLRRRRMA